jgi:iron-sulfur cluster repair protein YtfE (RIC family)
MNALKYLVKEHNKVRKMLSKIKNDVQREDTKKRLFVKLSYDLQHHEKMEQKVWYPFLNRNANVAETIKHLISEEQKAEKSIQKIKKIKSQASWENNFANLKKDVEHHANEEEKKLFPKVQKQLLDVELKLIGKKMEDYKKKLDSRSCLQFT